MLDLTTNSPLAIVGFVDEQDTREIVTIKTAGQLIAGRRYKISMDFTSILNDELRGFYRSSYMEDGVKKYVNSETNISLRHIIIYHFVTQVVGRDSDGSSRCPSSFPLFRRAQYESKFFHHPRPQNYDENSQQHEHPVHQRHVCYSSNFV